MFFTDIHDRDFIELLIALPSSPSSPAETRAHILGAFGVLVTGDNPVEWWDALTRDRGKEGAANAVAQLVVSTGGKRVLALIRAEVSDRAFTPRADDPKLARLLFDDAMEVLRALDPRDAADQEGLVAPGVQVPPLAPPRIVARARLATARTPQRAPPGPLQLHPKLLRLPGRLHPRDLPLRTEAQTCSTISGGCSTACASTTRQHVTTPTFWLRT